MNVQKQQFFLFAVAVIGILFLVPSVIFAEEISAFESSIEINSDGSFLVTENITYDFESLEKHGIFRYIPTNHPQESSSVLRKRYIDIEVMGVTRNGRGEPYEVIDASDEIYIKVGNPDETISGEHEYEITYTVRGGLSYFKNGGAELYWNVIGTNWEVPINNVSVYVTAPDDILLRERSCYAGLQNESKSCSLTSDVEGGTVFTQKIVLPGEGLTVAHAIDRNKVEEVILERAKVLLFLLIALVLWFGALIIFVYRYNTKYRTGNAIIPQYEPFEDYKPMYTGLLFDGRLDPKDITACIVYLAEQGYLKISKKSDKVFFFFEVDDYEIKLMKPVANIQSAFQRDVLSLLFGSSLVQGDTVTLQKLQKNQAKKRENQVILRTLKKDLEKDLEESGFFQVAISKSILYGAVGFFGILMFMIVAVTGVMKSYVGAGILVLGLSVIVLGFMYRRRTRKGYKALDHLEGFKLFLSVTETERYEFHNAPEKSPEQFMKYLPYAIAFGVEEKWAEVFEDITIPDPEWYDSGNGGHFSAVNLTTSLGAFSTAFSNSSGTSGSSGGGSVGGGGGGGGGGSW